jgi:phosphoglycerate dehydrogenase-like enzyme
MNLLIVLALPEPVRNRYYEHIRAAFPELKVDLVDHHSKVGPYIESADILVAFGVMLADHVFEAGRNLKWVQALGSGVDGIVDQPSLREGVLVTNLHGIHGAPVSEAAIGAMLALSRDLPRVLRNQARQAWERFPARLLQDKTAGIFGIGVIAEALAPKCKALGMRVVGISSTPRAVPGFDRIFPREALTEAVRELDYLILLTPHSPATHGIVDAKLLAAMKPTSHLINLARGGGRGRGGADRSARGEAHRGRRARRVRGGAAAAGTPLVAHGAGHRHPAPGRLLRRVCRPRIAHRRGEHPPFSRWGPGEHDQRGEALMRRSAPLAIAPGRLGTRRAAAPLGRGSGRAAPADGTTRLNPAAGGRRREAFHLQLEHPAQVRDACGHAWRWGGDPKTECCGVDEEDLPRDDPRARGRPDPACLLGPRDESLDPGDEPAANRVKGLRLLARGVERELLQREAREGRMLGELLVMALEDRDQLLDERIAGARRGKRPVGQRIELLVEDEEDEVALVVRVAEERAEADVRALRDLPHRGRAVSVLSEELACGGANALQLVALVPLAQPDHGWGGALGSRRHARRGVVGARGASGARVRAAVMYTKGRAISSTRRERAALPPERSLERSSPA